MTLLQKDGETFYWGSDKIEYPPEGEKEHLGIPFTRDLPTRWRLWIIGAIKKKL